MLENLSKIFDYTLIHSTIRAATPILFAALSACLTQQANILNVGTEGVMLCSAFIAVAISYLTGSWILAVLAAIVVGVIISWVIGVAHLKYNADVFAVGTVINMLALAVTKFLLNEWLGTTGSFYSQEVKPLPQIKIGFCQKIQFLIVYLIIILFLS